METRNEIANRITGIPEMKRKVSSAKIPFSQVVDTSPRFSRNRQSLRAKKRRKIVISEHNGIPIKKNSEEKYKCQVCDCEFYHKSAISAHYLLHSDSFEIPSSTRVPTETGPVQLSCPSKSVKLLRRFRGSLRRNTNLPY